MSRKSNFKIDEFCQKKLIQAQVKIVLSAIHIYNKILRYSLVLPCITLIFLATVFVICHLYMEIVVHTFQLMIRLYVMTAC